MRGNIHRRHFVVDFDTLSRLLGVQGEAVRVWSEPDNDYLHMLVNDPTAPPSVFGGYVEMEGIRTTNEGNCESCHRPSDLVRIEYNVCPDCTPSTTMSYEPAIIPSPIK